jgi:cyanophycin synthetase
VTGVDDKTTYRFPSLRPARSVLPLVAVAGSRGKSTVSLMLESILRAAGGSVAAWVSSGVYVDGERLEGELRPWSRVLLAARYGELNAVIQELEAAVVVGAGLPERTYPLAILTTICGNDNSCRLSMATELEERSLQAVVGAVRGDGCIVVNGDDLSVVSAANVSNSTVVMFAMHPDNPVLQRHLEDGLTAAWLSDGVLMYGDNVAHVPIIDVSMIPATLDGSFMFQIQNAMAAAAAAMYLGVDSRIIADSLGSFQPASDAQPGACNILTANGARVVVDSPLETWTLKMLARGIKQQAHRRSIVVSSCFEKLGREDGREVGRLLGRLGGVVILHADKSNRNQLAAIKSGIALNLVPPLVMVLPTEAEAIEKMKSTIGAGDTGLILTENPAWVTDYLGDG